jgi:hypothetical protein
MCEYVQSLSALSIKVSPRDIERLRYTGGVLAVDITPLENRTLSGRKLVKYIGYNARDVFNDICWIAMRLRK